MKALVITEKTMCMNKQLRQKVYDKYSGHCAYCGKPIEYKDMQIDHIIPKRKGYGLNVESSDDFSNLNPSCRSCNFRKGVFSVDEFRRELIKQRDNALKTFQVKQSIDYGLLESIDKNIEFYFEREQEK